MQEDYIDIKLEDIIMYRTKHGVLYIYGCKTDEYMYYIDNMSSIKSKLEYCDNHNLFACYVCNGNIDGLLEKIRIIMIARNYNSLKSFRHLRKYVMELQ